MDTLQPPSFSRGKHGPIDWISKLPEDILIIILTKITTKEAVKTSVLSTRWNDVWKKIPDLVFSTRRTNRSKDKNLRSRSQTLVNESISKIIRNHYGHLEGCTIDHYAYQIKDGTLETWIRTLTHEKQTKCLKLTSVYGLIPRLLQLSPNTFSHPLLESLILCQYRIEAADIFSNCHNLKILKLVNIVSEIDVFNAVIAMCPSLKVLTLEIKWNNRNGCLKIDNNNLKLLHLSCSYVDRIEVTAALLDILSVTAISGFTSYSFVLNAPRLRLNPQFRIDSHYLSSIFYNVSYNAQENENMGHKLMLSKYNIYLWNTLQHMTVNVDLMNPREVQMLNEVLATCYVTMMQLKICFKHDSFTNHEIESSIHGVQNKKWDITRMVMNANFRVYTVLMSNFNGSKEEFELASRFITQGIVTCRMIIKTSSDLAKNRLTTMEGVAKLMELSKSNQELIIKCL